MCNTRYVLQTAQGPTAGSGLSPALSSTWIYVPSPSPPTGATMTRIFKHRGGDKTPVPHSTILQALYSLPSLPSAPSLGSPPVPPPETQHDSAFPPRTPHLSIGRPRRTPASPRAPSSWVSYDAAVSGLKGSRKWGFSRKPSESEPQGETRSVQKNFCL